MASGDGGDQSAFQKVLVELMDTNNDIRERAEKVYESVPSFVRARHLLTATCNDQASIEIRQLAIVLFRRLLSSDFENVSKNLGDEVLNQMKNELMVLVRLPADPTLKRKICDAAAELAKNLIDDNGNNHWPEFLNSLFESVNSQDVVQKECALNMFSYVPGVFGNQQSKYLDVIKQMLLQCLSETTPLEVRTAAVKATSSFILAHADEKPITRHFQDTVLPLIQFVAATISLEQDHCDQGLNSLVELAEKCPQLVRPQFDSLMQLCVSAINPENNILEARRHLALEIIVSMSEAAPATVRKRGSQYLNQIVSQLLLMMTDIEDDDEWAAADSIEDDDYESEAVIGETSLDRLSCSVGGKTILPLVISNVSLMLKHENYKHRVAALMALSAVGEGCHTQMQPLLGEVVDGVIPFLRDPHFRVRYAACNCLGQMATDFAGDFQEKFHAKVIPSLLEVLDDHTNPRVQSHAGAALVNFFEECTSKIIIQYLHPAATKLEQILTQKMVELTSRGTKLVLEQCVVTLAALADSAQENFLPLYDIFVPKLKYIIEHGLDEKLKTLRGKAIEAVSLIGLAVGKEKFCSDAVDVMDLLLRQQTGQEQLADDDPQLAYMISAWARICKILGPDFAPYLPFVMGPVLKAASHKIEIALLDRDDVSAITQDSDWQCVNVGEQQAFGIKTTGLEEKATACQMLVCYARELKQAFVNYIEDTLKIMVPLLKFYFHDDIRIAAAESLPYLLEAARSRGDQHMVEVWNFFADELFNALQGEPEREVLAEMFSSLTACIEKMGRNITKETVEKIITVLDVHLKEHFIRAQQRQEKKKDEDYDEGVEEILEDEGEVDVYVLSKVSDILHTSFVVFGEDFIPFFDQLLNHFKILGAPDRTWNERQWSICVFDDVIENTGPACTRYKDFFLPLLMEGVQNPHPEIRQAASYGWGVLGQNGGAEFATECANILPFLKTLIEADRSRSPENINATENAISAVTKIIQYNASQIPVNEVLPSWMSWLPVFEDEEELPHVYGFLLLLLENNHPLVLGENNCNLPKIVAIFAEVFARNAMDVNSAVGTKIVVFLKNLQQNANVLSSCVAGLNDAQKTALQQILA